MERINNWEKFNESRDSKLNLEELMKKYILRTLYKDGPNSVSSVEGKVFVKLGYIEDVEYIHYYRLFQSNIKDLSKSGDIIEYEVKNTNFLKLK